MAYKVGDKEASKSEKKCKKDRWVEKHNLSKMKKSPIKEMKQWPKEQEKTKKFTLLHRKD